jgi:hypothetical protein
VFRKLPRSSAPDLGQQAVHCHAYCNCAGFKAIKTASQVSACTIGLAPAIVVIRLNAAANPVSEGCIPARTKEAKIDKSRCRATQMYRGFLASAAAGHFVEG